MFAIVNFSESDTLTFNAIILLSKSLIGDMMAREVTPIWQGSVMLKKTNLGVILALFHPWKIPL